MSATITIDKILAASPTTTRGQPTILSSDNKGQRIAYASGKSIFVRSIDNPAESVQYNGHTATTTMARFSPSGFKIASGDVSGMVRVWEPLNTEITKGEYPVFSGRVNDIAWDGDSQRIIAVGDGKDRFGRAITADSGNSVGEISGHAKAINAVAMRAMRPFRAATVADDGAVCFLHGVPFAFKKKEAGMHSGNFVFAAAYAPDGSAFVTAGADKRIQLWDGREGTHLRTIGEGAGAGHAGSVFGVSWAADGKKLATASADQTVRLWDVETGKAVQTWRFGGEGGVSVPDQQLGVAFPHGRTDGLIVSLSLSGDLNYVTEGTAKPARAVQGHNKGITALGTADVQGNGEPTLWTGSFDGRVLQWDVAAGRGTLVDGQAHSNQVVDFAAPVDGAGAGTTYSVGWDDALRTVDQAAGTFLGDAPKVPAQPKGVAAGGDGLVFVATANGVAVYSGGSLLSTLAAGYAPTCIAAHSSTVAVGGDGNAVRLYKAAASGTLSELLLPPPSSSSPTNPTGTVSTLAFSPDGKHLAAGNSVGKIYVYETGGWTVAADRWSAHTARVTCIAWEAGGKHAVSGALDTNVHVWCLEPAKQGKRIKVANAHKGGVTGVCWVGRGKVASVGGDAAVKVWRVENLP